MIEDRLMKAGEIIQLASIFKEKGVEKIRLTGGEPCLRKDLIEIIEGLKEIGITPSITTNGALLDRHLDDMEKLGMKDLNISIDSLKPEKFKRIAQRDLLYKVLENIKAAAGRSFNVKLNVVVMRDFNDDEILDLLNFGLVVGAQIRFIEYMPFFGNSWEYGKVFSYAEVLNIIESVHPISSLEVAHDSTSKMFSVNTNGQIFGIISTVTNPFCSGCSRLRLTADGKMKNCLFSKDESDLLGPLRAGADVSELIDENIKRKKKAAGGRIDFSHENAAVQFSRNRSMIAIGG